MVENIISFCIFLYILYARSLHKVSRASHVLHIKIALSMDVLLILYLVLGRRALTKINADMHWMLYIHIPLAIATVAAYGLAFYYGQKIIKGDEKTFRPKMKALDKIVIPLRALTLITSVLLMLLR